MVYPIACVPSSVRPSVRSETQRATNNNNNTNIVALTKRDEKRKEQVEEKISKYPRKQKRVRDSCDLTRLLMLLNVAMPLCFWRPTGVRDVDERKRMEGTPAGKETGKRKEEEIDVEVAVVVAAVVEDDCHSGRMDDERTDVDVVGIDYWRRRRRTSPCADAHTLADGGDADVVDERAGGMRLAVAAAIAATREAVVRTPSSATDCHCRTWTVVLEDDSGASDEEAAVAVVVTTNCYSHCM